MSQPRVSRFSFKLRLPFFALPSHSSGKEERKRRASSTEATRQNLEASQTASQGQTAQKTDDFSNNDRLVCPLCRNTIASSNKSNKKKSASSVSVGAVCKCRKGKNFFRRDPRRHSHAGTSEVNVSKDFSKTNLEYFEDEADLFEGLAEQGVSGLSDEDTGVCVTSSFPSLSPTSSTESHNPVKRRGPGLASKPGNNIVPSKQHLPKRPASCTFGNLENLSNNKTATFVKANFLDPNQGMHVIPAGIRSSEMTTFRPRSSCSTIIDADSVCPICQMCYDASARRKLVDSNCGHSRCFKCMFQTNTCPLCCGVDLSSSPRRKFTLPGCDVVNHHNKTQSLSGSIKLRHGDFGSVNVPTAFLPGSLHSRESGFQSFASSMSSVCSRVQGCNLNSNQVDVEDDNDDCISLVSAFDRRSVASGGSFISLMSCQTNLPFDNQSTSNGCGINRNDFKRHSLSSFKRNRSSDCGNSVSSRNSGTRRSAIITRSSRMSSIEENRPAAIEANVNNSKLTSLLRPLFFEVPKPPIAASRIFVGRKWLFREILEHLSSDLPTSKGITILGSSTTGKTSIILQLVQNSYFGQKAPSMSSSMEILARQVVGYHFCSLDNESTCTIPEFVHSLAAQLTQNPNMSHFNRLVGSNSRLQELLSYPSCLADPSQAFIEGILEPLKLLRSQGKFPHQRSLILIDSLCEAEYHRSDNGDTLASFLKAHLDLFPNWLRVICTVRTNMLDIVKPFTFHRLSLDNIDNIDERLYKDMQDFVFQRIRESPLIQKNITPLSGKLDENQQANLAHYLIQSSGGCFLYADMVLNLFHDGKLQLKSSSLSMVPLSLSEIFLLEFNLRFPTQESFLKVKDILSICVATLRPMTMQDIWNTTNALRSDQGSILTWDEFSARYQLVSWLLPKRADMTCMFFHSTARDWLMGRRTVDSNKFLVDPRDGHAAIALQLSRRPGMLDPEQTLELGHHLLKANLFRRAHLLEGFSVRYLQAIWIATASKVISRALASPKNISSPNLKVSRLLLLAGASPDAVIDPVTQESLVSWYSSQQNLEMIQLLSEFGANVNATNSEGITPLMVAAAKGSVPIIQCLVNNGAAVNATDSKGSTALVFAARWGHLSIVSVLLSYDWPNAGCKLENTVQEALVIAAREGHQDILETLLNCDRVNINGQCVLSGETALCAAATAGKKDSCKLLLKKGASGLVANRSGAYPLHQAITDGHYAIVDLLLNAGLPVDQADEQGRSPLLLAASVGQVGVLELLLARGANKDFCDKEGLNGLCWAVMGGKHRALDLLIKQGIDIESLDASGRTALHHAAVGSDVRIVEILLANGANVEAVDKDGIRPIDRAIGHSNEAAVMQMLKKGAKLGPTTWAMAKGKPRIALVLLNKLLEDGNTLFRHGRLNDAAYRYEYALKRLPRLKQTCNSFNANNANSFQNNVASQQQEQETNEEDIFVVLKSHLLLNLSRTRRKECNFSAAVDCASQVIAFRPTCYEAYWARAKARRELNELDGALTDLREAIKLSPKNMELHRFTMQVKAEIEARPPTANGHCNPGNQNTQQHQPQQHQQPQQHHQYIKCSPQTRSSYNPMPVISSTPKKELESEV